MIRVGALYYEFTCQNWCDINGGTCILLESTHDQAKYAIPNHQSHDYRLHETACSWLLVSTIAKPDRPIKLSISLQPSSFLHPR